MKHSLRFVLIVISIGLFMMLVYTFLTRVASPSQLHFLTRTIGVFKPEVIGFQPYWLARPDSDQQEASSSRLVGTGKQSYAKEVTTLAYFSLAVEKDGTIRKEDKPGELEPGWLMLTSDTYAATLSAHRKKGTKLSLLVQNMVEEDILSLIATPEAHATKLVEEVEPIMQKHGFTDLNLDIESFNKASESARLGYVQFVRAVKDELTRRHLGTLTVELTPKSPVELHLIDVARIGEIADYLVLMAYDYHYVFSSVAGPVAPLGGVPTTAEYDVETALKETLRYAPASKVILGVPLYGYEWETLSPVPGAAVIPGSWQLATGKRMEEFTGVCVDCTKGFDPVAQEPYVIFPGETPRHFQQAFYENKDALQAKIALAKKYQLAGVALWAVGYESDGMLDPIDVYKNSVHYRGFGMKPAVPYTRIQPASLTLSPPTHALVGSIATMSGVVKKMGRQDEEYQVLESASWRRSPIVQGESVAAGEDGKVIIQFSNAITMEAGPWSELSFSELLPPNIAIRQKGGTVTYRLLNKDMPWSVRVLRTLAVLQDGEMDVSVEGPQATVFVPQGKALLGAIDADNVTSTFDVAEGQTAYLDDTAQTVVIK